MGVTAGGEGRPASHKGRREIRKVRQGTQARKPGQMTSKTSATGNQVEMSIAQLGEVKERSPIETEAVLEIFLGTREELCLDGERV